MGRLIYNIFMPLVFIFFLPHLISKYRSRGGWKSTFGERFGRFGSRKEELSKFLHFQKQTYYNFFLNMHLQVLFLLL